MSNLRSIFHIDANSAYLSWTAVSLLEKAYPIDIREVPAVISGNPENRHGIILAKSIPAKKFGISTGESLFEAKKKCPEVLVFPPDYDLYLSSSNAMFEILNEYTPRIQRYSIDECFLDYTESIRSFGEPIEVAYLIKERMKKELGFSVNIGVSVNKLLAKMGSELKKPDRVHTLYPNEIENKLWPLPVGELFMVGRATVKKLKKININTIGALAKTDPLLLQTILKSHGLLIWNYANGIDDSQVIPNHEIIQKGIGNSTTIAYDITEKAEAMKVILGLTERVSMRLRKFGAMASLISISIKTDSFVRYSHQIQLQHNINTTSEIYKYACMLFNQCWKGEPIRHLGVSVSNFCNKEMQQLSLFDLRDREELEQLEKAIDKIRQRFGDRAIMRAVFTNGQVDCIQGGVNDGKYLMMGGYESENNS